MKNDTDHDTPAHARSWQLAYWVLFVCWVTGAAMNMWRVRGGFLTNYLADLTFPPWFYINLRGLSPGRHPAPRLLRTLGRNKALAASSILMVGVVSELRQLYWPTGPLAGTFDPWDIVAFFIGVGTCYFLDKS